MRRVFIISSIIIGAVAASLLYWSPNRNDTTEQSAPSTQGPLGGAVTEETEHEAASVVPLPETSDISTTATPPKPAVIEMFRMEGNGSVIVAGRADTGAKTTLWLDDSYVQHVDVGSDGKFASFLVIEESNAARTLSLRTTSDTGELVQSENRIIIAATPAQSEAEPAERSDDPTREQQEAKVSEGSARTVLMQDSEHISVLQSPATLSTADDLETVSIDTISYSESGKVEISGRGQDAHRVRIYVNNRPTAEAGIKPGGNWAAELPDIAAGVHKLRVDEIRADERVASRVEIPFQREMPERVSEAQQVASSVTVQPGSTLWAISRERYGDGVQYVRIFDANKQDIRNPDLIYPGQIFQLPE